MQKHMCKECTDTQIKRAKDAESQVDFLKDRILHAIDDLQVFNDKPMALRVLKSALVGGRAT